MAAKPAAVKFTYEDYLLIPEDGKRHEIIEGEEYVAPAPTTGHQRIVRKLLMALGQHVENQGWGEVFVSPIDVILSEEDVVQPDVLYVSAKRGGIIEEHSITGAPDLIVEVLSEGNRRHDEIRKRKLYARYGVEEYWIADPELETVKVYRAPEGGYDRAAELSREEGDALTSPLLPDFSPSLNDLFARPEN